MGDDDFDQLYSDHARAVVGYLMRRLPSEDAREVAAEVFLVAWRRRDELPEAPLPWLLATARRQAANHRRGQRRHLGLVERVRREPPVRPAETPTDRRVTALVVREALTRLSADDQELLRLVTWDDLDMARAAEVLGCSAGAVRVRLHRARQRLEAELARVGYSPALDGGGLHE